MWSESTDTSGCHFSQRLFFLPRVCVITMMYVCSLWVCVCMCVSDGIYKCEWANKRFFPAILSHTHTHTRVGYVYVCGELFGHEASTCCNRSEKRFTHAVTWPHTHTHTHTRTHTNSKAHLQINSSIAYSHSCSISYWQTAGEKHLHTHSLSLRKHFPEACGRETFTSIRFQPGPRPRLQQKCAYSISICTHTHTTWHCLPVWQTTHSLFYWWLFVYVQIYSANCKIQFRSFLQHKRGVNEKGLVVFLMKPTLCVWKARERERERGRERECVCVSGE